jgi:hypothetical protein
MQGVIVLIRFFRVCCGWGTKIHLDWIGAYIMTASTGVASRAAFRGHKTLLDLICVCGKSRDQTEFLYQSE